MGKWWISVMELVRAKSLLRRLSLWFSLNKAQIRRSSSIQGREESSISQGWVSLSLMTFTVVYERLYSSNISPAPTRPGVFASHVSFDFWANLNGCVWNFKRSRGTSGVASAFSSIYNNFKKFCCEFLRRGIVQVLQLFETRRLHHR